MLEAIRKTPDICRTKPAKESHTNTQKRSRIKPRTIKNQQWMFTRLQIVSPFSEKSANEEITDARARLTSRVLRISLVYFATPYTCRGRMALYVDLPLNKGFAKPHLRKHRLCQAEEVSQGRNSCSWLTATCQGDMAVCMRTVVAIPRAQWKLCTPCFLSLFHLT